MSLVEELRWRGMLHDLTPGIEELLDNEKVTGYIGFDPTAPSLTIGNYVQIMLLTFLKKHGHKPLVLMGGATGRIGDPSGRNEERQLKSFDELEVNLQKQKDQMRYLLGDTPENPVLIVNNYDFYKDMSVLDYLRDVGKHLTVNYMLSKDSVQNRLETGISFTEFSYQLLQGYDFFCLKEKYGCLLQMGGSDQWGNITTGTELIRRINGGKAYALTTPLLTKADGTKFGKSEKGNLWLDANMTSPYQFYQFWINADDRDLPKYYRYFSLKSKSDIESLESEYINDPRALKTLLAEEITERIHGANTLDEVRQVSSLLFNPKFTKEELFNLSVDQFLTIKNEIPSFEIAHQDSGDFETLLTNEAAVFTSKSDFKRAIQGNALIINKEKPSDVTAGFNSTDLIQNRFLLVENGKKNKYLIDFG